MYGSAMPAASRKTSPAMSDSSRQSASCSEASASQQFGTIASPRPTDCDLLVDNALSVLCNLLPKDTLLSPCSPVSFAVGLSTLASAGPPPSNPYLNCLQTASTLLQLQNHLQQLQQQIQQQQPNGLEGMWAPAEGESQPTVVACMECKRLKRDVQDSKLTVANVQQSLQTVCLVLQYYHQQLQILAAGQNALVQAQAQTQAQNTTPLAVPQSPMARTAPRPPQPECPVPLRPMSLASSCATMNPTPFINWPWNLPMGISSPPVQVPVPETPTSSAALPTTVPTQNTTSTSNQKTEGAVPEMKWSSPSSVDSIGQKTDSTAVTETPTIDVLGMDGSESTSSASTMAMVTSPEQPQQTVYTSTAQETANYFLQQTELGRSYSFEKNGSIQRVGIIPTEKKRKPVSDDYVKLIRQQDLSEARIAKIQIPVIQALRIDPDFKPNSEQQVIQTVIQNRKYEENNHRDSMILLCKKLAERRVFGAKLMAQTTVAGLNHSNYSNLPEEGIIYIQHVCKKVLREKFPNEEEFWDAFREATKKLAARCRRVRHAKKNKNKDHDGPKPPSSELATTLRSLNMANLTENRTLIGNDIDMSSAAEALQSLSRTSDLNPLQAFSLSNHLNGILNNPPSTWSSVLTAATQPLIKTPKLEQAENEEIYEEKLSL